MVAIGDLQSWLQWPIWFSSDFPHSEMAHLKLRSLPRMNGTPNRLPAGTDVMPPIGGLKILLAEDDSFLRKFYAMALNQLGFSVQCAEDGLAAWEALLVEAQNYALVITDNEMPRLKGLDLARRLKCSPFSLPVIMISGSVGKDSDYSEDGIRIALPKPCSLEDIKTAILCVRGLAYRDNGPQSNLGPIALRALREKQMTF